METTLTLKPNQCCLKLGLVAVIMILAAEYAQPQSKGIPAASSQELVQIRHQAESGDPRAMFQIIKKSQKLSNEDYRKWLTKSAELGYGPALFRLAKEEAPAIAPPGARPIVVPGILSYKDRIKQAYEHLLSWAQEGDVESMYMLGSEISTFKKLKIAKFHDGIFWLRRASEAGHPDAPLELALTTFNNGESTSEKLEGFELVKTQALKGNCTSLHLVCNAYIYGKPSVGLVQDLTQAQEWIDLLAKHCGEDETAIYPIHPHPTK